MTRSTRYRDAGHGGLRGTAQQQPAAALAEDDDGLVACVFRGASPGAAAGAPWPPRVASCKIARTVLMDHIEFFRVFFWSVLNLFLGQSDFGMVAALKLDPFCVPI